MNITLTWDLVIIVFAAIVVSYSYIIGKNQSVKVIIATYIAIIATQGIGNVLARLIGQNPEVLTTMGMDIDPMAVALMKICAFAIFVVGFVLKSGIDVEYNKDSGSIITLLFTGLYGFATAGLMVSTILTYATARGILDTGIVMSPTLAPIVEQSPLMQLMILNQDIWFTLPAFLLIAAGFIHND